MKVVGILILVALLGSQSFLRTGVVTHFQIHRCELVSKHCQKRFFKENNCQGVCHLKKLLNAFGKEQTLQGTKIFHFPELLACIGDIGLVVKPNSLLILDLQYLSFNPQWYQCVVFDFFHPPD
jgi:hypothetical protein